MLFLLLACTPPSDSELAPALIDSASALPADTAPTWVACEGDSPVRINEIVVANHHGALDEDGETSDWLELSLADGALATDLDGWGLSDDGLSVWTLPARTLGAAPLQVWASDKDRTGENLHADFSLNALGDGVFLHQPGGCVAEHVTTPRMYADVALGRAIDGSWAYFMEPTPGASNTTESRPGFAESPTLSPSGGFVSAGTIVSATGTGTLRYTTDGGVPSEEDDEYPGAVVVGGDEPDILRVRAFVDGLWPSRVTTQTYSTSTSLPETWVTIISLTAEPGDLFDRVTGIYEYGPPDYETWYPYFGANFWEVWERDVHVEVFAPGGTRVIDQDGGIQIAGGYSRAFDQRNFEIIARSGYGPETFDAHVFPNEANTEWHKLYLRNGGDWCGTQLVDGTVQSLFRDDAGVRSEVVDAQAYAPALVYINGEFWGLYEMKERLDEWWPAVHRGADPENLDFLKVGWTHEANWTVEQGDTVAFDELEALVASQDLRDDAAYADFVSRVDVENLAGTIVAQGWIGNTDFWSNNLRLWRPREDDGRFRWMAYDFGHGWPDWRYDHLATTTSGTWEGLPIGAALRNQDFRDLFANVHADFLNTSARGDEAAARFRALADEVRPVMEMQRDRWCGGAPMSDWEASVDYAERFAANRAGVVDETLQLHLGLSPVELTITADPPGGGRFELTVVSVESGFVGTYYEGVPVTVRAVAEEGYAFVGWSGDASGVEAAVTLPMGGDTEVVGVFEAI